MRKYRIRCSRASDEGGCPTWSLLFKWRTRFSDIMSGVSEGTSKPGTGHSLDPRGYFCAVRVDARN